MEFFIHFFCADKNFSNNFSQTLFVHFISSYLLENFSLLLSMIDYFFSHLISEICCNLRDKIKNISDINDRKICKSNPKISNIL